MSAPYDVAIEEAAHALGCVRFGWPICDVTIIPDGRYDGCVTHDGPPADAEAVEQYVIAALGYEARRKLAGGQDPDYWGSVNDFANARRQLEAAVPDLAARVAVMKRGDLLARHIVTVNWTLIEALADRLERDRRLSGAQVLRLVREHQEGVSR